MRKIILGLAFGLVLLLSLPLKSYGLTNPSSSSIGLEGTINSAPPSQAPTISSPSSGAVFSNSPITINGLCKTGLLIKVFDNNIFIGSVLCVNGAYSLQIALFNGLNQIVVYQFDALEQSSPASNTIDVTYNSATFLQFGTQLSLTSAYAEKGADPGSVLTWPIVLSGGTPPYAISVDWGDGTSADLYSESSAGTINISHTYNAAGTYTVIIKATDKNGEIAFLQVVGQAVGQITSQQGKSSTPSKTIKEVVWWPVLIAVPLIGVSFYLGSQYRMETIREKIKKAEENK